MQDGLGVAACHQPVDPSGAGVDEGTAQGRRRSTFKVIGKAPEGPQSRGHTLVSENNPFCSLCSQAEGNSGFRLRDILLFPTGLTLKLKVPFTRQEAKGVGSVISKILITQVNELGMLSQQAHAGCFTRDLTSQQREAQ